MSEWTGGPAEQSPSDSAALLALAVDRLSAEDPVELPGPAALERLRTLLACAERLRAGQLTAVRDLDSRQLYALDAAGSARGWLRRQPGGEDGQVTLARRLARRPLVSASLAGARIGLRTAGQLCTALEHVPADLDDALVTAVVQDGIGRLLLEHTGGTPEDPDSRAAVLAQRAADTALLRACCADVLTPPAARVEPAFVLLAERLAPAELGSALRLLLDPLQPDGTDQQEHDPYYLDLRILADGDVDIRGLLDPETGHCLAAEIERRLTAARAAAAEARRSAERGDGDGDDARGPGQADAGGRADGDRGQVDAGGRGVGGRRDPGAGAGQTSPDRTRVDDPAADAASDDASAGHAATGAAADHADQADQDDEDPLLEWDRALADAEARAGRRTGRPGGDLGHADRGPDAPLRTVPAGRRRHDALRDLLQDAATVIEPGAPAPSHLTVVATLAAVEGRLGALPAQLVTPGGRAVPLRPETLQRLGCNSLLDAVLLDAQGNPVGASSTRRMPNRRERRAMQARWGSRCAIDGCHRSDTVPHHVRPWWLCHLTQLLDLVPLCASCHHDLHEGHRTLRLRDRRLIDDHGWVTSQTAAAA